MDFTSDAEYQSLYDAIVTAIQSPLVNSANFHGVDNFVKVVWGNTAKVALYADMTFYVYPGRAPTDFEISISGLLSESMPLPIGSQMKLVNIL